MTPRRRVLFLLPFPPDPDGLHGGSRMTGQLLEALTARHEVGAVYLRGPGDAAVSPSLRGLLAVCEEVPRREPSSASGRAVRAAARLAGLATGRPVWVSDWTEPGFAVAAAEVVAAWKPAVVQAEFHVMAQYLSAVDGPTTVLGDHEPGAAASADRIRFEHGIRRLLRRVDTSAWRRYERSALRHVAAVVVFTDEDAAAVRAAGAPVRVERIRPGVRLRASKATDCVADPPRIVFLGSFVHPPNVESALRLCRSVYPLVRARRPDAVLEIVGDAPPPELRALAAPGVVVTGRVDDPSPYLARAAIVAAPIASGGGIRMKVLEALAAGKAVVATPRALAGIPVVAGEHALVASDDEDFAGAVVTLLDDADLRRRIGSAAHAWTAAHLSWADAAAAYAALYEDLLAGH